MKRLMSWAAVALSVLTAPLAAPVAAQSPVVVELYTSQGCSSCPPADALLHELAERDDVIALALHVDYWDYIGWKDAFADPAYAERQRNYARAAGRRAVYTPQMIVAGETDIVGSKPMRLSKAIAQHAARPALVDLSVTRGDSGAVQIAAEARGGDGPFVVQMVRYQPQRTAEITRGENAGQRFTYANVTEDWQVLAEWDGLAPLTFEAEAAGDLPLVVLIQEGLSGPIRAAALLR